MGITNSIYLNWRGIKMAEDEYNESEDLDEDQEDSDSGSSFEDDDY